MLKVNTAKCDNICGHHFMGNANPTHFPKENSWDDDTLQDPKSKRDF